MALEPDDEAIPCGLIAKSIFNDTFKLYEANSDRIPIKEDGIAWDTDKDHMFKRGDNYKEKDWLDVENEHFIV